jgi:hypothetical protein
MVLLKRRQILDEYEDDSSQAKAAEKTKKKQRNIRFNKRLHS